MISAKQRIGFGTPFVAIHTYPNNKPINTRITDRISSFIYAYTDEGPDEGTITIRTSQTELLDLPELQEGISWRLVWGFMEYTNNNSQLLQVANIKSDYTAEGITITVTLRPPSAVVQRSNSGVVAKGKTMTNIAETVAKSNDVDLVIDDGESSNMILQSPDLIRNPGTFNAAEDLRKVGGSSTFSTLNTWTKTPGWVINSSVQGPKNDYSVMKDNLELGEDKWNVSLQDNAIILRRRNLKKKPIATVSYRGDGACFTQFTPEVRNDAAPTAANNTQIQAWDSDTKTYQEANITKSPAVSETLLGDANINPLLPHFRIADDGTWIGQGFSEKPKPVTSKDIDGPGLFGYWKQALVEPFQKEMEANKALEDARLKKEVDELEVRTIDPKKDFPAGSIMDGDGVITVTLQHLGLLRKDIRGDMVFGYRNITQEELAKKNPTLSNLVAKKPNKDAADGIEKSINRLVNSANENAMRVTPASMVLPGNPIYKAAEILTVEGVAKKHTGNYYISQAIHEVVPGSGWTCRLTLYRNSTTYLGNNPSTKAKDFGIDTNTQVGEQVKPNSNPQQVKQKKGGKP